MDRLPKRFEDEAGLYWIDGGYFKESSVYYEDEGKMVEASYYQVPVSKYELAGIGLEAIRGGIDRLDEMINGELQEKWWINGRWTCPGVRKKFTDQDFCECVFKAIREVYKDVMV